MGNRKSYPNSFESAVSAGLMFVFFSLNLAGAQPAQRIHGEISENSRFAIAGNVHGKIAEATDQGPAAESTLLPRMTIHFAMTPSQNADLLQLSRLQQTLHSTQFHRWLSPEQFADRFGMNAKDIQKVTIWLESMGFTDVEAARSRNLISFSGTAGQAQLAFNTAIHRYLLDGRNHYANESAPELPSALRGMVAGIRGLHDFQPKPRPRPRFTSSISGNHFLVPDDFATIYDIKAIYQSGIDGTGVTIAIPGQTDLAISDIQAFRSAAGLSASVPQLVLTGRDPGTKTSDLSESDLDVEWAGGIAKGAQVVYVYSTDVFTSLTYAITNNLADVIPVTYGNCEATSGSAEITSLNAVLLQAITQGITVIAAAGDQAAADCDGSSTAIAKSASNGLAVDFPASSPYVTGVGGSTFNEGSGSYWSSSNNSNSGSALSYIPEVAWNDTNGTNGLEATGGGVSTVFTKPPWQMGAGVPADGFRDVPDVALTASPNNDAFLICSGGSCVNGFRRADTTLDTAGGTSGGSPSMAGIVALLVQKSNSRQGNINANLYTLASVSTDAFHDITSGNNIVPCTAGSKDCGTTGTLGYSAGANYDQVSGLGSIDVYHLINEWPIDLQTAINPTSLKVARGSSGTATINVTETNYSGPVTFTCAVVSPLTNTTCSVGGNVTGSGTTTLTVTAGATASAPWWLNAPHVPIANRSMVWLVAGLLLAVSVYQLKKQSKMKMFTAPAGLMLIAGLSSCGSGSSSTTPTATVTPAIAAETGMVRVVGVSGNFTSSATIAVTIQ